MIMNVSSWRKALIEEGSTIKDAVENLDQSALQISMVVSQNGKLLGTVTDGDIRRALIKGTPMGHSVREIMHTYPLVVPPKLGKKAILQLMQANKVQRLPVVDEQRHVCGLHLFEDLVAQPCLPNQLVIMAGGKGTRLRPLTHNCPKPMLPVGKKPLLEHIIVRAKAEGIQNIIIAINYLGDMIEEYFKDGAKWDVNISYLRETEALGTAGALSLLNPLAPAPIIVCNGDVLTDIHYAELLEFHEQNEALATMAVKQHEWQNPFGVVKTKGIEITHFEEKPIARCHVNAGIYVLSQQALQSLKPHCHCDMPSLFEEIQNCGGKIIAYPMHEPWLDIGRPDDLAQARISQHS